ncbi:HNH endonuclease [Mesobacillus boroniphilus]|uniref:HNH endonuclease n=1 Tax=Mesobacillus boroniphilus TaxID=308892 RepID=UPI0004CFA06D|nr:HNH endonuclease [Mesobacillus boroniphilus]
MVGRDHQVAKKKQSGTCELCGREEVEVTIHHLTPKEMGGTFMSTANLCIPCHKQIHALFTNEELATSLNTVDQLRSHPELQKFLKWIKKQPSTRLPIISKSNARKRNKR